MTLNELCDQIEHELGHTKDVYLVDAAGNDLDGFEVEQGKTNYYVATLLTQPDKATTATLLAELKHLKAENERFAIVIRRVSEANERSAQDIIDARELLKIAAMSTLMSSQTRRQINTFLNGG